MVRETRNPISGNETQEIVDAARRGDFITLSDRRDAMARLRKGQKDARNNDYLTPKQEQEIVSILQDAIYLLDSKSWIGRENSSFNQSKLNQCKKILADAETKHVPTISHYKDDKNGMQVKENPFNEYIFLVVPKNSQSRESSVQLVTFADRKAGALQLIKNQVKAAGRNPNNYNYRLLTKNPANPKKSVTLSSVKENPFGYSQKDYKTIVDIQTLVAHAGTDKYRERLVTFLNKYQKDSKTRGFENRDLIDALAFLAQHDYNLKHRLYDYSGNHSVDASKIIDQIRKALGVALPPHQRGKRNSAQTNPKKSVTLSSVKAKFDSLTNKRKPLEQFTGAELEVVDKTPEWFEIADGYVFLLKKKLPMDSAYRNPNSELSMYSDNDILNDYLMMLEDFGAKDITVIEYRKELAKRKVSPSKYKMVKSPITGLYHTAKRHNSVSSQGNPKDKLAHGWYKKSLYGITIHSFAHNGRFGGQVERSSNNTYLATTAAKRERIFKSLAPAKKWVAFQASLERSSKNSVSSQSNKNPSAKFYNFRFTLDAINNNTQQGYIGYIWGQKPENEFWYKIAEKRFTKKTGANYHLVKVWGKETIDKLKAKNALKQSNSVKNTATPLQKIASIKRTMESVTKKWHNAVERGDTREAQRLEMQLQALDNTWKSVKVDFYPETRGKNSVSSDYHAFTDTRLNELTQMFQGQVKGVRKRIIEPDIAPKEKATLGYLAQMIIKQNGKKIPINFDGESFLSMDIRKNLWAHGKDAKITNVKNGLPRKPQLKIIGDLVQIDYITDKKNGGGNGKPIRFWHPLGEATGEYPKLAVDYDGFPVILGGGYDIWKDGIVN